jgi:alkylhydroperoxidase family enzyme
MLVCRVLLPVHRLTLVASILLMTSNVTAEPGGVRLSQPRIEPLPEEAAEMLRQRRGTDVDPERVLNLYAVMANHPELSQAWFAFGSYILRNSTIPPRDRELVILRIGWLCQAAYEWSHHSVAGIAVGLTQEEVLRITEGPNADGWSQFDRTLLRAVDELHEDSFITDDTWKMLAERYGTKQLMDLVFTVGQYTLVSMALNSFGVQLDEDRQGFPE